MGISNLLTKESAEVVAKHILKSAVYLKDSENVNFDCDFKINQGILISDEINTWLKFDLKDDFYCQELRDVQQAIITSDVPEEYQAFDTWTQLVATFLETKYKDKLADKIRQHLLGGVPREGFPLKEIKVKYIEIDEIPTHDKTMRVDKAVPKDKYIALPVSERIFELMDSTGKTAETIVEEKKAEGDPDFECVTGVTFSKEFYEISVDLWVDYSPDESTRPEEAKKPI